MIRHRYHVFRNWTWEFISVSVAIGLLIAISVLLVSYDGNPAPDWGTHLNFNALLALLSTILRAMLVVIVSQIICQQKWAWYGNRARPRPLSDLQQFDSGSRGSFGALMLVPKVILKDPVTLIAAVVLVVSFLVGPFVQQASRTMPCTFSVPNLNASLPYAHYVPRQRGFMGSVNANFGTPKPDVTVAILSSVTAPDGVENRISPSCSTGNCTFDHTDRIGTPPGYLADQRTTHSTVAMCDTCIDVSPLVSRTKETNTTTLYTLPWNRFNVSWARGGTQNVVIIKPTRDLSWLGDLLTSEIRAMSRWAYVNATYLAVNHNNTAATAVTCILYPCLRTFTASITNNQLLEEEVSSEVMEIEKTEAAYFDSTSALNAESNWGQHYVTVKNPCQVGGQVYDITQNTPSSANATSLSLYNFTGLLQPTYRTISVPGTCIYRHQSQFVMSISTIFNEEMFDGLCSSRGRNCRKPESNERGTLSNLGVVAVLNQLTKGDPSYSNVTSWFNSFADAMTNRFRFQYGAARYNATDVNLPMGEVKGLAWRTELCVSAHRDWLALPICLTAITTLLMLWTIGSNWRERRTRPVWKESLLPLLFYGHKIDSKEPEALPWPRLCDSPDDDSTTIAEKALLMEASEMDTVSKRTSVMFQWLDHAKLADSRESANSSAIALRETRQLLT
jgi:hypothetical protein